MLDRAFTDTLPFLCRPENIARYDDGAVILLDRRCWPFEVRFETCRTLEDTARAIENMVTQSLGPGYAAACGMVQAARAAKTLPGALRAEALRQAARRLIATRPTNHEIRENVTGMLPELERAALEGDPEAAALTLTDGIWQRRHEKSLSLGRYAAALIPDGAAILNHCWAETTLVYTLHEALAQGKKLEAYCTETRPYLQGARLTASAIRDFGIPVTVITDNMPAACMQRGKIGVFFSGTDRVTMDGHVINKVGTLGIALAAKHFGVPYYAFCYGPDRQALTPADVRIEERDPDETLYCRGVRTAAEGVRGYYPAFDVTPPELVTGLSTDRGVFPPDRAAAYFTE